MPKKLGDIMSEQVLVRCDAATIANIQEIIDSGLAADRSAALRAAVAIAARLLAHDPAIYVVEPERKIFGTLAAAESWIAAQGAQQIGGSWLTLDKDGAPETYYDIRKVLPA